MSSPPLVRFVEAMSGVYGPLPSSGAAKWMPPPSASGFKGRYLWTDAFGVVNFLTLYKETGDEKYLLFAKSLVRAVPDIQGRTRDGKSGLLGATDENPLGGGLRIGKEEATGSDGDGQYHHYLTLWMFALNRLSIAANDPSYNAQAASLAKAIHPHFFVGRSSLYPRMVWKIAVDMSRPLVHSEGNLDPIDGYVIFRNLQAHSGDKATLSEEIADYKRVMDRRGEHFVSKDPLDLGMSLWTAHWLAKQESWAADLADQCTQQLRTGLCSKKMASCNSMRYRLAFREYGACMGIGCHGGDESLQDFAAGIVNSWEKHSSQTPGDLRPITQVMYAAAIFPGAFKMGYLAPEPSV